jgi:hypothetical protein
MRGERFMKRTMFTAYLAIVLGGVAYFIAVGLLRL